MSNGPVLLFIPLVVILVTLLTCVLMPVRPYNFYPYNITATVR